MTVRRATAEPVWVRRLLTGIALGFLLLFLVLPLVAVFWEAFANGAQAYWAALQEGEAHSAMLLTLTLAALGGLWLWGCQFKKLAGQGEVAHAGSRLSCDRLLHSSP
jgi:ABC-type Fe3+ transport system permease subunit